MKKKRAPPDTIQYFNFLIIKKEISLTIYIKIRQAKIHLEIYLFIFII